MMAQETAAAPWRVLIVDDEENLNWSLVTSLRKDGYIVDGAHTGEEALVRLQAAPYDCVVSDIKMPGMDGFELLQWLRQYRPSARVVMMTSFGSPSARQDALRDGAVAYFEKPFDLRALKDQLRRMAQAPALATSPDAGYDLLDVAQVISLARRDVALEVRSGGYAGMLRFQQGELLWAEAGELVGDAAFLALCVPRGGRAQMVPWNGFTERNVTQPVARLIYAALARRDGRGATAARLASEPPQAATAAAATDLPYAGATTAPVFDPQSLVAATLEPPAPAAVMQPPSPPARYSALADPVSPADAISHAQTASPAAMVVDRTGGDPTAALETLARALPPPCGVVWIGTDAGLVWQRWNGQAEIAQAALTQLHMAVRAAAQASAVGDLGVLGELRIVSDGRQILLRRGPQGGTLLLSLAPEADDGAVTAALRATMGTTAG